VGISVVERESMAEAESGGERVHIPVLPSAVLAAFARIAPELDGGWIFDGTVGMGGHAELLLEARPSLRLVGCDQDPAALELAGARLARFGGRVELRRARLSELRELVEREGFAPVAGILVDLGVSSLQLDTKSRGFSFQQDGPLDMRMDPTRATTAADLVNGLDEESLADLIHAEGEEPRARRIAKAIVEGRRRAPFLRTLALADCVAQATGRAGGKIHPATLTFQALRRAVNAEHAELELALECARATLAPGGVFVAISFHSLEDGVVKRFLAARAKQDGWELHSKKPVEADHHERRANPRARSARLRAARRPLALEVSS
jgi:16S rRNA (cytosine1402-N4)-methyltransferase